MKTIAALVIALVALAASAEPKRMVLESSTLSGIALPAASASVDSSPDTLSGEGGPARGSSQKSLANGLYMTGAFIYVINGNSVTVALDGITNDSSTRTSGTLRLELWASSTAPGRGQAFNGYKLAQSSLLDPLAPRFFYSNLSQTVSFGYPPDGTYWIVLVLTEFSPGSCPGNLDSYCQQDSFISFTTRTFGNPVPPSALENPQPGSYQSGVGLISGWSCQQSASVAVQVRGVMYPIQHGSNRSDTASICGTASTGFGLLVNYNSFGAGTHTAQLYVNGAPRGSPASFTVTTPAGEFATGLSRQVTVPNFPSNGRTTTLIWQQSQQNFAIQSVSP